MKKYLYIYFTFFIFFILILCDINVCALSVGEVKSRNVCGEFNFEVGVANIDGSLDNSGCFSSYNEALTFYNNTANDDLVILERVNGVNSIINSKYAFIDFDQKVNGTSNLYKSLNSNSAFTYIAGGSSDEAPLLDFDYQTRRIKIRISGLTAYLAKYDSSGVNQYDIIPLNWVKTTGYYTVGSSGISHVLKSNLFGNKNTSTTSYTYGVKPDFLNNGTYYSYDGKYFYTDIKTMINDYKNDNFNNSVNVNNPYYNYYLYLSHRSKTNYTSLDIDNYLQNVKGFTSNNFNLPSTTHSSMLYKEGTSFYNAQELYGTNALLMFGVAVNESGWGRSNLSINKNNIFGHNAVDSDPFSKADAYQSIMYSIYAHAYRYLSYGYLQPGDVSLRFNGASLGNKAFGANVKYASDPYWGEKAASNYYNFDKTYGLQDYNFYKLAVLSSNVTVYPKKSAKSNGLNVSSSYYKLNLLDTVILIVGEETSSDGEKWYKIMSDPMLDSNLEYTGSSKSNPRVTYNWDTNNVYVPAKYFTVINNVDVKNPKDINYGHVENPDTGNIPAPDTGNQNNNNQGSNSGTIQNNLPSTDNPYLGLENRNGNLYYFNELNFKDNKVIVSGFLGITGMNNSVNDSISHRIIMRDVNSGVEYVYGLERWLSSVPFEMSNSDEAIKYDYSGGWFKGNLDFSNLPQGDYYMIIEVSNGSYRSRSNFNNLFFNDMVRKITLNNGKGIQFTMNYLDKFVPMDVQVRNNGLISSVNPPTTDTMYNSFDVLEFIGNKLHIKGASHSVGVSYASSDNVERTLVLENTSNYNRYNYNVGSITNGSYEITLRKPDNKSKTRAWFDSSLDLSSVPSGVYAIYIKTKSNGFEDHGELADLLYTDMNMSGNINGRRAYLRRVDEKRFRVELVIE